MNTDTPRTDAVAESQQSWPASAGNFARTLERENAQLKAIIEGNCCTCSDPVNDGDCASCKINAFKQLKSKLESYSYECEMMDNLRAELAAERASSLTLQRSSLDLCQERDQWRSVAEGLAGSLIRLNRQYRSDYDDAGDDPPWIRNPLSTYEKLKGLK
jgi:hypothetical protein